MENVKTTKTDIYNISPLNIVVEEGFNSRVDFGNIEELSHQIREQGMLNPISVIPFKDENGVEKYRLVDGERRYRAVMSLINEGVDITRIKALFLSRSLTLEEKYAQQFLRNEGKNFTEYELGILCAKMRDKCGKTISEIAKILGKNPGIISYALKDLEYDERIQELLRTNKISGANVRKIYSSYGDDEQGAINEILGLKKKAEIKGKHKVSLKDIDFDSKASVTRDSKIIMKGIDTLMTYVDLYSHKGVEVDINLLELLQELHKNKTIKDVFDEALKKKTTA